MPRAFNTPRCRNLGFSMNRARRAYLRSFGCPFMSWNRIMRERWGAQKLAAAQAKATTVILGIDAGGADRDICMTAIRVGDLRVLSSRKYAPDEIVRFFGVPASQEASQ